MVLYKYSEDITNSSLPLSNNLYSMLQRDILMGKLKEGEKLTEQRLCDEYSVSRTPVREALRQLEINGLVENIPNRGSFVVGMSERDIRDIFDLRMVNEVQAVRWAIQRIT
ncbi:MAG: GntR family transcriptional regulator, partial [Firmicutes bacterium]|nr:GntR family transcriptional regulator [Bacillota bacterium]